MAGGQQQQRPVGSALGREGSRWYNERPTSEAIAAWFKANVPFHEELADQADRYVGGLTLIGSKDYTEEPVQQNGGTFLKKVVNQVWTPYCKVETRVQYFWDLMALKDEWLGVIEPVAPVTKSPGARDLPPGFFYTNYPVEGRNVTFVCCTMQVRVYERESVEWIVEPEGWSAGRKVGGARVLSGKPVMMPPPATKMIPVLSYEGYGQNRTLTADAYSLMKAETGAVGRALGLAGMLVVPGTGVATAEDMLEAQQQGTPVTTDGEATASLPEPVSAPEEAAGDASGAPAPVAQTPIEALREDCETKLRKLKDKDDAAHDEFQRWAREDRGFKSFADLNESELRGVSRKLDRALKA